MRTFFSVLVIVAILVVTALFHLCLGLPAGLAFLASLAIAVGVHTLVIAAGFALSRISATPIPAALQRKGHLLRAFVGELKVSLWTFHWAMPWRAGFRTPRPTAATGVPILLLHGYLCNRGMWRPTIDQLAARGHPISAISMTPLFGSIDRYLPQVEAALAALLRKAPEAVIIGHSMGGLVGRRILQNRQGAGIARLITLGTPHEGTRHARIGLGENARQMRRGSDWLKGLEALERANPHLHDRVLSVMSYHDNIVAPQDSALLPGSASLKFTGIGHLHLATHPAVLEAIRLLLDQASDQRP